MLRRTLSLLLVLLTLGVCANAREKRFGYCQAQTTGARVKTCTVEVFLTGTLSHPTQIYQDNIGTPLGNPFTASASTGLWFFYADNGEYDIKFSGGVPTISPAYTLSDYLFLDLGTQGQSIQFGGDVLPLFTNQGNVGTSTFTWGGGYYLNLTSTGALAANALTWTSGTGFAASFVHANTMAQTYTFPNASGTIPLLASAQSWTGVNTFAVPLSATRVNSTTNASIGSGGFLNLANADSVVTVNGSGSTPVTLLSMSGDTPIVAGFSFTSSTISPVTGTGALVLLASTFAVSATTGVNATLQAGDAVGGLISSSRNGGNVNLIAGQGVNALGQGGNIVLTPGSGTGGAGSTFLQVGVGADGSGMKHLNTSTGSISGTTRAEVTLTWTTSFADTNYDVTCSVQDSTSGATAQGLVLDRIRQKTAALVTAVINNPTGGALTGTLACTAVHN